MEARAVRLRASPARRARGRHRQPQAVARRPASATISLIPSRSAPLATASFAHRPAVTDTSSAQGPFAIGIGVGGICHCGPRVANRPVDAPRSTDDAFDAPRARLPPLRSAGTPLDVWYVRQLWRDSAKKAAGRYGIRIIDTFRLTREPGLSEGKKRGVTRPFFPEGELYQTQL